MTIRYSTSSVEYNASGQEFSVDAVAELPELSGHYKFDDASGLTAVDSIGNFGNASLLNMVGNEWTTGQVGGGLLLDGIDDELSISGGHPNIFDGGGTFMGWVKHSTGTSTNEQFFRQGSNAFFRFDSGGKLYFKWNFDTTAYEIISDNVILADTLWHHYAVVYSADSVDYDAIFYVDGVAVASTRTVAPVGTRIDMSAVTINLGGTQNLNGIIDDYRFYSRRLNPSEMKSIYDNQLLQAGLVGHWKLDEASGTTAVDSSTSANNGTLTNMIGDEWTTGRVGGGLLLDGIDDYVVMSDTNLPVGSAHRTVALWMKVNNTGVFSQEVFGWGTNNSGERFVIGARAGNWVVIAADGGAYGTNALPVAGIWFHVAVTFADTNLSECKMYINGVEVTTSQQAGTDKVINTVTNGSAKIGVSVQGGSLYFGGGVDDIRVYGRALTASEITHIYALGA